MKINVKIKKLSRMNKIIADFDYELPFSKGKLSDLICFLVEKELERYNSTNNENIVFLYRNEEEIEKQSTTGKVGFGVHYNPKTMDLNEAISVAYEAFNDGLVKLFIDEKEYNDLDEIIEFKENSEIILFRLTFLTGRMY